MADMEALPQDASIGTQPPAQQSQPEMEAIPAGSHIGGPMPQQTEGEIIPPDSTMGKPSPYPDGMQRFYETSGLKNIVEAARHKATEDAAIGDSAKKSIGKGNYAEALETLLMHLGKRTASAIPGVDTVTGILKNTANESQKAGEALADKDYAGVAEHAAGAVPILGSIGQTVGPALGQDIQKIADNPGSITNEPGSNPYDALAGDVTGALAQIVPLLWGGAKGEEAATADVVASGGKTVLPKPSVEPTINSVRPSSMKIAGVDVPVSSPQLAEQVIVSKGLSKMATNEGAQKFIDEQVQPAAEQANRANFAKAAAQDIEHIQHLRGETPNAPKMETLDDMSHSLKNEARTTYQKLDEAGANDPEVHQLQAEVEKAQDAYDEAQEAMKSSMPKGAAGPKNSKGAEGAAKDAATKARDEAKTNLEEAQDTLDQWLEDNTFTKLQDKINSAKQTLSSKFSSVTDKATAKESIPIIQEKIQTFLDKHADAVEPGEFEAANGLHQKGIRYDFLAKQMRTATHGTNIQGASTSPLKSVPTAINPKMIEGLPAKFDNKFGEGAFHKLLGDEGLNNFNQITEALKNPIAKTPSMVDVMVGMHGLYARLGLFKKPFNMFANQVLFNPKLGSQVLKYWKDQGGELSVPLTGSNETQMVPTAELDKYKEFDRNITPDTTRDVDMGALKDKISKEGVTEPLTLKVGKDGKAHLWDGNHRLAVAKQLGIKELPVQLKKAAKTEGKLGVPVSDTLRKLYQGLSNNLQ